MLSPAPGDGLAVRGTVGGKISMSLRAVHGTSRWGLAAILGIGLLLPADAETAITPDTIKVVGNRRVEAETVRSYFAAHAGRPLDAAAIDAALKAAYASGLFRDVQIKQTADGLIVMVAEAPVIDHIQFEGATRASRTSSSPTRCTPRRAAPCWPPPCRATSPG